MSHPAPRPAKSAGIHGAVKQAAAFAAREVSVSTEGIVYATGGNTEAGRPLRHRPPGRQPLWKIAGRRQFTDLVCAGHAYMSTVAIVKRETGGWGWPILMTLYMNGLAYGVCLLVFQIGSHLGF